MLRAYRGEWSDRRPVAPEFWYYYPAKLLGVSMLTYEREIPMWQGLLHAFRSYDCEGWGAAFAEIRREDEKTKTDFRETSPGIWTETTSHLWRGREFSTVKRFSLAEPSWLVKHAADEPEEVTEAADWLLSPEYDVDLAPLRRAWEAVGESYLLECWTGSTFTDFIGEITGFENAVLWFADTPEAEIRALWERYTAYQTELIEKLADALPYEAYTIGCSYACCSLFGTTLWRKWDKPYIAAVARLLHRKGKLLHIHFHGRSIECAADFAEAEVDCVCPFERGPGGDVTTPKDLRRVRTALGEKVTFNGNVHTVETLIRGTPKDVSREVSQLLDAFAGSPRLIVGTGDQVGYESKEENLHAMVDAVKAARC